MVRGWRLVGLLLILAPWVVVATEPKRPLAPISLTAWRKADKLGRACVSCHSPDGIEIAAFAFSDEDITRRALSHLSLEDAQQVVGQIHAVREQYHITKLLDPMKDRPMQPGGELLAGRTPMERDASFAAELPSVLPLFFARPIRSLALAQAARDQLLAVDLSQLKVGIPVNLLSEDVYHGSEHALISDWLPDMPMYKELPVEVQDAYLAEPSLKHYAELQQALEEVGPREVTLGQTLSFLKRRVLFYYQQSLRDQFLGVKETLPTPSGSPMWNIGELGRVCEDRRVADFGFPADIAEKKKGGATDREKMRDLRLGWYWLGWTLDPGLQKTSRLTETLRADYFSRYMWSDGPYPMHLAFMMSRKIASESFVPSSWSLNTPQHLDLNYSFLVADNGIRGEMPTEPGHLGLFRTFMENSFRMNLLLQMDELSRTHRVYLRLALLQQIRRMQVFFTAAEDKALADRAIEEIGKYPDAAR